MNSTIELVSFKLNSDADESALADIQPAVNQFIKEQPGFHYRSLLKEANGEYLDIVYWESLADAKAAGEKFIAQPWAGQMMSLIDENSINMRHIQSMSEVGSDNY